MLQLLTPAVPARVTINAHDGQHTIGTEIPAGQSFDPSSLECYGDFELVSVEVFPHRYQVTACFEHISDLDPWEWESGQRKACVVSFPHETGELTKTEMTQLKAARTGFYLVGLYTDRANPNNETEF